MLRKVDLYIMEPTSDPVQLSRQLEAFVNRAKEAACSLFKLYYLPLDKEKINSYTALAKDLLGISTLTSSLPDMTVFDVAKVRTLSRSIESSVTAVKASEKALQEVDSIWQTFKGATHEEGDIGFHQSVKDLQTANDHLHACVEGLLASFAVALSETLIRKEKMSVTSFFHYVCVILG